MQHISPYWGRPWGTTTSCRTFLESSLRVDVKVLIDVMLQITVFETLAVKWGKYVS